MSSDSNHNPQDAFTLRERLPPSMKPTPSLLDCDAWVNEIKRQSVLHPPEHEEKLGPYYRPFAPYRAKLSAPFEIGETIVIKGQVWSHEDKSPLPAKIEVWQANHDVKYENDKSVQVGKGSFINRARVHCDEHGYFEIETVWPGGYERGANRHAPHIHFRIKDPQHVECVTQILFEGDPRNDDDPFRDNSEIIRLQEVERNGNKYKVGVFNIVLRANSETPDSSVK